MVKTILFELYPESTSRKGSILACDRYCMSFRFMLGRFLNGCGITQITRSNKREDREPKETVCNRKELRDHLKTKSPLVQGDGGFIVGLPPKGARMFSSKSISEGSGIRPELNNSVLPKRFIKLMEISPRKLENFKFNDTYTLMFNMKMYEVAY